MVETPWVLLRSCFIIPAMHHTRALTYPKTAVNPLQRTGLNCTLACANLGIVRHYAQFVADVSGWPKVALTTYQVVHSLLLFGSGISPCGAIVLAQCSCLGNFQTGISAKITTDANKLINYGVYSGSTSAIPCSCAACTFRA